MVKTYRVWRRIAKDVPANNMEEAEKKFNDHGTVLRDDIIVHGLVVNGLVRHIGVRYENGN